MSDMVNAPPHYKFGRIECIDAIESALGAEGFKAFLRGQVMRYLWRGPHKGPELEDYRKGSWYLNKLIEVMNKEEK